MRVPRIRFTIGRLMVAVFLAGLALWGVFVFQRTRKPSIPELQAEASYKQARLVRIYFEDKANYEGQIKRARSDLARAADRPERSNAEFALEQAKTQLMVLENYTKQKQQVKSVLSDAEEAIVDELAKLEVYRLEKAKRLRWGIFGY